MATEAPSDKAFEKNSSTEVTCTVQTKALTAWPSNGVEPRLRFRLKTVFIKLKVYGFSYLDIRFF